MKGLRHIPSLSDLAKAYKDLLHEKPSASKIALYSQWSRIDPRLAEILATFIAKNWKRLDGLEIRTHVLQQPWPSALAVLLEFSKKTALDPRLFQHWCRTITQDLAKASGEQFFIGLRKFAGDLMFEDAVFTSEEYRRWGYLGREQLVRNAEPPKLSIVTRQVILKSLSKESARITTSKYWDAIGRCISKRQAERELRASKLVVAHGNTRARVFSFR